MSYLEAISLIREVESAGRICYNYGAFSSAILLWALSNRWRRELRREFEFVKF